MDKNMKEQNAAVAEVQMLIRKPVAMVFEAFIDYIKFIRYLKY